MRAKAANAGYRVVIITLDAHPAGPVARASERLARDFPGLTIAIHAAAGWSEDPSSLDHARRDIAHGDIVIANLLFLEEHVQAILMQRRADLVAEIANAQTSLDHIDRHLDDLSPRDGVAPREPRPDRAGRRRDRDQQ